MDPELLFRWIARLGGCAGAVLCIWYLRKDRQAGQPTERWTQAALALFLVDVLLTFLL